MPDIEDAKVTDDYKELQQRLIQESVQAQFRKGPLGGLNKKDVMAYVENVEARFRNLEQEYQRSQDGLFALRARINSEAEEKKSILEGSGLLQDQFKAEIDRMVEEIHILENALTDASKRTEQAEGRCRMLEEKMEYEMTSVQQQDLDLTNALQVVEALETRIAELMSELETQKAAGRQTVLELEEKIESEMTSVKQRDQELKNALRTVDTLEARIAELMSELEDQKATGSRTVVELEKKIESEMSFVKQQDLELKNALQTVEALEARIAELAGELEIQKSAGRRAALELDEERTKASVFKIKGFKGEFREIYDKIERLAAETSGYEELNSRMRQQAESEKQRADKAEKELAEFLEAHRQLYTELQGKMGTGSAKGETESSDFPAEETRVKNVIACVRR